ncbi:MULTISPECIES: hypothetical protein [Streptomyces]|uniref:Uncharacterized protein n=1 Tax=Streptomyces galilaeus TaxID=33899 RepID=A0ABW9IZE4_STRGJ
MHRREPTAPHLGLAERDGVEHRHGRSGCVVGAGKSAAVVRLSTVVGRGDQL